GAPPPRPRGGPRRPGLARRVAAVPAAVAVVAGGGYGVVRLVSGNSTAGTAASERAPVSEPKAAAPGMSAGGSGSASFGASGSMASYPRVVSSGTNYQPGQLKAQVTAVLTRSRQHAATGAGPTLPAPAKGPSARSPACVAQVTGGKRPLLVDLAKYQGRPATIIVVPGQRPGTLRALVVAGECTPPASRVLATVPLPGSGKGRPREPGLRGGPRNQASLPEPPPRVPPPGPGVRRGAAGGWQTALCRLPVWPLPAPPAPNP